MKRRFHVVFMKRFEQISDAVCIDRFVSIPSSYFFFPMVYYWLLIGTIWWIVAFRIYYPQCSQWSCRYRDGVISLLPFRIFWTPSLVGLFGRIAEFFRQPANDQWQMTAYHSCNHFSTFSIYTKVPATDVPNPEQDDTGTSLPGRWSPFMQNCSLF